MVKSDSALAVEAALATVRVSDDYVLLHNEYEDLAHREILGDISESEEARLLELRRERFPGYDDAVFEPIHPPLVAYQRSLASAAKRLMYGGPAPRTCRPRTGTRRRNGRRTTSRARSRSPGRQDGEPHHLACRGRR